MTFWTSDNDNFQHGFLCYLITFASCMQMKLQYITVHDSNIREIQS